MFNGMFSGATLYIILGLSATTLGFGYLSYHLYGSKVKAEEALMQAINANSDLVNSLNQKELSCKIDDQDTAQVEADKKVLQSKVDELSNQISKLKSGIKKPTQNTTEAPKNAEANTILDGTELLSDDLRRMLEQSFCLVETCSSLSPGQSSK